MYKVIVVYFMGIFVFMTTVFLFLFFSFNILGPLHSFNQLDTNPAQPSWQPTPVIQSAYGNM